MTDSSETTPTDALDEAELAQAVALLERIANDRSLLMQLSREERNRFLKAAGRVAFPDRKSKMQLRQAFKKRKRANLEERKAADEVTLAKTGIRTAPNGARQLKKACAPAPFELDPLPTSDHPENQDGPRLQVARSCYICKQDYDRVHFFYDSLCPQCADFNWTKREQTADLTGRYALVTGGRVKIGFHAVLKLLRAGVHVVVTTRFPSDAAQRFVEEEDSADWNERLQIHGIDLRHAPSVDALCDHLVATLPRLDFLLNNACQTVRRPPGFYQHLMDAERTPVESLPSAARSLLASHKDLRRGGTWQIGSENSTDLPAQVTGSLAGIQRAAELSQIPLVPEDHIGGTEIFPTGEYDGDQQQVDLREINSWRLKLAEVETVELLEVHLVNAVAPFILNARLKPLMLRVPTRDKHIVNVSAMEGVFYRAYKTDKHPHTNMAKAALNMLTRTSAKDYVADGIHMNSVDTGWITDEDPAAIAERKTEELGFHPPLDQIDAAARICDPFFSGLLTGEHLWGNFLKDYRIDNW